MPAKHFLFPEKSCLMQSNRLLSVPPFNHLQWLLFYVSTKIGQCCILYKRTQLAVSDYFIDSVNLDSSRQTGNTRFSNYSFICTRHNRETEGGRAVLVQAIQTSVEQFIKKQASLISFNCALRDNFIREQWFFFCIFSCGFSFRIFFNFFYLEYCK